MSSEHESDNEQAMGDSMVLNPDVRVKQVQSVIHTPDNPPVSKSGPHEIRLAQITNSIQDLGQQIFDITQNVQTVIDANLTNFRSSFQVEMMSMMQNTMKDIVNNMGLTQPATKSQGRQDPLPPLTINPQEAPPVRLHHAMSHSHVENDPHSSEDRIFHGYRINDPIGRDGPVSEPPLTSAVRQTRSHYRRPTPHHRHYSSSGDEHSSVRSSPNVSTNYRRRRGNPTLPPFTGKEPWLTNWSFKNAPAVTSTSGDPSGSATTVIHSTLTGLKSLKKDAFTAMSVYGIRFTLH